MIWRDRQPAMPISRCGPHGASNGKKRITAKLCNEVWSMRLQSKGIQDAEQPVAKRSGREGGGGGNQRMRHKVGGLG